MLVTIVLVVACSSALYIPTSADADRAGSSTGQLMIGRNLYINKCGSCHNLHLPEQYTKKQWLKEMPEMQKKAKITEEESKQITSFLLARCKEE